MWKARIPVGIAVGLISCVSQSEILTLEGASYAEFLNGGPGSDAYPFNEIGHFDDVYFSFEFDTDAEMVSLTEGVASYEFVGLDFLMQIGDIELSFDSLLVQTGATDGAGLIHFIVHDEALDIFARFELEGTNPVSTDLPTNIDLDQFNSSSRFNLDSDLSPGFPAIVSGPIYQVGIIPAPGAMGVLLGSLAIIGQRRR